MRTLARLLGVPFVRADATKFTETGIVGEDAEDLVRQLVEQADGDAGHGGIHTWTTSALVNGSTAPFFLRAAAGSLGGLLAARVLVGAGLALLFIDEAQSAVLVPHLDAKPDGLTLGATLSF